MGIHFEYQKDKAEQVVLWFLHHHGGAIEKLKLVKLMFFADREHLARYGRPVVGGRYVAMPYGPVASQLLNDINTASKTGEHGYVLEGFVVRALVPLNEDFLSESDIEVLEKIDKEFGAFDGFHLRDLAHNLKAYKKNFVENSSQSSFELPYEDFFEDLDADAKRMLDIISEDNEAIAAFE